MDLYISPIKKKGKFNEEPFKVVAEFWNLEILKYFSSKTQNKKNIK